MMKWSMQSECPLFTMHCLELTKTTLRKNAEGGFCMYMMLNEFLRPIRNAKFERQRTVKMSFDRVSMEREGSLLKALSEFQIP